MMNKFLTLLLMSPIILGDELNFDSVIEPVLKDLDKLTSLNSQCVSFYLEGYNKDRTKAWIEIREVHNEECGGDPGTAPRIASVYVLNTGEVYVYNLFCNNYYRIEQYSWDMDCSK